MIEIATRTSMGVLLVLAAPVGGQPTQWAQWGLAGIVIAYTLWRDREREKRMSEAIEAHHRWVRETLVGALERNSSAIERLSGSQRTKERE